MARRARKGSPRGSRSRRRSAAARTNRAQRAGSYMGVDITPLPHTAPWDVRVLNTSSELSPTERAQEALNAAVLGEGTARNALDILKGVDVNDFEVDIDHAPTPDVALSLRSASQSTKAYSPSGALAGSTDPPALAVGVGVGITPEGAVGGKVSIPGGVGEPVRLGAKSVSLRSVSKSTKQPEPGRPTYSARTQDAISRLRSQGASEQDIASAAEALERQQRSGLVKYDPSYRFPGEPAPPPRRRRGNNPYSFMR